MIKLNRSMLLGTILTLALGGCANSEDGTEGDAGQTGTLNAALSLGEGATHDVVSAHFVVVPSGGSCTDVPIAETIGEIEAEALQGNLDPSATPAGRAFIDGLMVLPPGDYMVCVTPLQADGTPSAECSQVTSEVTVEPEKTNEVVLLSQCEGDPNGALDVVVGLNDPPLITDLDIGPSKFITTCQKAELSVEANDPNGDAMSYDWEIVSGPSGGLLVETGATAEFTPSAAGDYELKVTVTDATGGTASLSFPIHVSQAEDTCDEPAACPSGTYDAGGYCWVVAQDFMDGAQSCEGAGLVGAAVDVTGVYLTDALLDEVVEAVGCTPTGDVPHGAPTVYFDAVSNTCFHTEPSDGTEQSYHQAPFSFDGSPALHVCQRPE